MNLTKFMQEYNILKKTPRTGWLSCAVPLAEVKSVAEHTLDTTTIAMLLIETFKEKGYSVNSSGVLKLALIHDWAEMRILDIPYTSKKYFTNKSEIEESALRDILGESGFCEDITEEYIGLWKSKDHGLEGKIVGVADLLSMFFEHIELRKRGFRSRDLDEHYKNCKEDIKKYCDEYKFLKGILGDIDAEVQSYE